jgi:SlyX protein
MLTACRVLKPMPHPTEDRLTELEIKASFSEDLLDRLNEIIVRQQLQIDHLLREVALLREQDRSADPTAFRSLREELPPHY